MGDAPHKGDPLLCPHCGGPHFDTIDTRPVENGIRRRRRCRNCEGRFTTYERLRGESHVDEEYSEEERRVARAVIDLLRLQRPA